MLLPLWITTSIIGLTLFHLVAIPAVLRKKNDFADILWGPVFPLSAAAALYYRQQIAPGPLDLRSGLVFLLVLAWAVRLVWHVGLRNLSTKEEDPRYHSWRKNWGNQQALWSYLKVFLLQGVIMLLIASPIVWVFAYPSQELDGFALAGLAVWLLGFFFETAGDYQLKKFKRNPANKGKIMTSGVWRWSRHPNYFGEVTVWWGLFLFALPLPWGWVTIGSPLMITFLILKVSGIPMLEAIMEKRAGWAEYKARTNALIPWPPRG